MVSLEAISGLGNQKKSLLINWLVAVGDSLRLQHSSLAAQAKIKSRERKRKGGQEPEDDEPF